MIKLVLRVLVKMQLGHNWNSNKSAWRQLATKGGREANCTALQHETARLSPLWACGWNAEGAEGVRANDLEHGLDCGPRCKCPGVLRDGAPANVLQAAIAINI